MEEQQQKTREQKMEELIQEVLKDHPNLTREQALAHLEAAGA